MIIPPSGTQSGTTGASTGTTSSNAASQLDQDTFLKLMVAQLRNQDPMNPTDSSQFLAQTAQFSSLEKLQQMADQQTKGLAAQMSFGASTLAGRTVTYTKADGTETSGTVSSVRFDTSGPLLDIGGDQVTLDQVVSLQS